MDVQETQLSPPAPATPGYAFAPERYYSPRHIEAMTGITPGALATMRHRGDGPAFTRFGRAVFYRGSDLIAYLEAGVSRNTAEAGAKRKGFPGQ